MNQQTEGLDSSTPSNVPMKRKRGRPRKVDSRVQGTNVPVMPGFSSKLNPNQTVGTVNACDDGMLGKEVTCVIEGTFNGGYLVNVQVAADTYLRGVVFLPERVVPVTAESDVTPQVRMIERTENLIPVLDPETRIHGSVPLSGQCNKQPFEAKRKVPVSVDPVLPTEQSGISVSLENQSAPVMEPMAHMPKINSSIYSGGIMPRIPISVLNPETRIHSSFPLSGQCNKQPFEAERKVPVSVDSVLPSEQSGIPVSLENQSAPVVAPLAHLPKINSSIYTGGIMPRIPIPVIISETQIHSSVPSSRQCNKQPFEAERQVPMSVDPVLPTEQSGIPVSLEKQSAPVVAPLADFPKIDSSIYTGGIMPRIPIPVLNPETRIHSSVPLSGQCNKQPFEAELQVPMSEPVLPTELHFGISVSLENQSTPVVAPLADLPKIESSISTGGIMPKEMSKPGPESQPASIMSEFEGDKTIKQDETLHEVDASRQAKESIANGGVTKDFQKTSEPINLVPTVENTEKELTAEQQSMPSVYNLNELIPDEPKRSIIEINQIPESAEHESMPSEHINNTVENFMQKQVSPEADTQEDTKTQLLITKVDSANSNGRPSTGLDNIPDVGSNHALELIHPSILYDREPVPSESKLLSEGSDFQEMSDPLNCSSFSAVNNVDANQPTEVLVISLESENPSGSDTSLNVAVGKDGEGSLV